MDEDQVLLVGRAVAVIALLLLLSAEDDRTRFWRRLKESRNRAAWMYELPLTISQHAIGFELFFDSLTDKDSRFFFRFTKQEIFDILPKLDLEVIMYQKGLKPSPLKALCVVLWQLAYDQQLGDGIVLFGRSRTWLSIVFLDTCQHLAARYRQTLEWDEGRLILDKLQFWADLLRDRGCGSNIFGFIDGTFIGTARPGKYQIYDQRELYSGHKKHHGLQFQGIMTPDGILSSLSGPFEGNAGDMRILEESGFDERMMTLQRDLSKEDRLYVYGDKGYFSGSFSVVGSVKAIAGRPLTREQKEGNKYMSKYRVEIEHCFGHVVNNFKFVHGPKKLRVY